MATSAESSLFTCKPSTIADAHNLVCGTQLTQPECRYWPPKQPWNTPSAEDRERSFAAFPPAGAGSGCGMTFSNESTIGFVGIIQECDQAKETVGDLHRSGER